MANRDNKVSPQPWVHWGISKEEFDTYKAAKAEWDKGTPAVGSDAPDFEVECLDPAAPMSHLRAGWADLRKEP
jgi:hypothetical protein